MATFRFEINTSRATSRGTYPIWIRISIDGKRALIKTSIEVSSPKDFTQLYTLMYQSHKIKAAPKFKLKCGYS